MFFTKKYVHVTKSPGERIEKQSAMLTLTYRELDEICNAVTHVLAHARTTPAQDNDLDKIREKCANCCISLAALDRAESEGE